MSDALERLTPAHNLDRDALLFATGRASARVGRGWKLACLALLAGHLAWVFAWRDRAPILVPVIVMPTVTQPPPTVVPDPIPEVPSPSGDIEVFRRRIELPPMSVPSSDPAPSGPVLTAGTDLRTLSFFN